MRRSDTAGYPPEKRRNDRNAGIGLEWFFVASYPVIFGIRISISISVVVSLLGRLELSTLDRPAPGQFHPRRTAARAAPRIQLVVFGKRDPASSGRLQSGPSSLRLIAMGSAARKTAWT